MFKYYLAIKHIHITSATLSILFFLIRVYWSLTGSKLLKTKIARIMPHVIDTILLVCGVFLAAMIGPEQPWILAKIVALVFYIGFGTVAIKRGKTRKAKAKAAIIAVLIFAYIVGAAIKHSPASWFVGY